LLSQVSESKEPYFIADILNNAVRRGDIEKKYDDAVARLYRTIEMIAQYQLNSKYDVNTSNVKVRDIPEEQQREWQAIQVDEGRVRIGLDRAYELLLAKGDMLGDKYSGDEELKKLLSKKKYIDSRPWFRPHNQRYL